MFVQLPNSLDQRDIEKMLNVNVGVKITRERYIQLLVAEERLKRLESGGVDNWSWYGESLNPDDEPSMDDFEEALEEEIPKCFTLE